MSGGRLVVFLLIPFNAKLISSTVIIRNKKSECDGKSKGRILSLFSIASTFWFHTIPLLVMRLALHGD